MQGPGRVKRRAMSQESRESMVNDPNRPLQGKVALVTGAGAVITELNDHITDEDAKNASQKKYKSMDSLQATDIAAAILYACTQPQRVSVNEILVRPTDQTQP